MVGLRNEFKEELKNEVVEITFNNEGDFFELLDTLEEIDTIEKTHVKDIQVTTCPEIGGEICSTGLYLSTESGTSRLPESAIFSTRRRLEDGGEIFNKMTPEDQAERLNKSIPYLEEKEVQVYRTGDLVKGIHSKAYSPIKQKELFKAFRDNLLLSYGEFAFIEATYRHDMTEVVYEVTDLETAQRYAKALIDAGEAVSVDDLKFLIALRTSDSADRSVSVQPYVMIKDDLRAPLSIPMGERHRDGLEMQDIRDMFLKIYSYNADSAAALAEMTKIELHYPSSVIKRVVTKFKLPIKPMKAIADRFNVEMFGRTMTAHDLYMNACLAMREEKFLAMKQSGQESAMDAFSRILKITPREWEDMDKPGPTLYD